MQIQKLLLLKPFFAKKLTLFLCMETNWFLIYIYIYTYIYIYAVYSFLNIFVQIKQTFCFCPFYSCFFQIFLLSTVKFFPFINSAPICSSPYSLYKYIWHIIRFVISMYMPLKMVPAGVESTWEKYCTFLNSFNPDVHQLIWRLNRLTIK